MILTDSLDFKFKLFVYNSKVSKLKPHCSILA